MENQEIKITKYHTMAYYPFKLFEYEAVLGNGEKVYFNFDIELDAEKKGVPVQYTKCMEYWRYNIPLDKVTDESSEVLLDKEIDKEILMKGIELWNEHLDWQEEWIPVSQ